MGTLWTLATIRQAALIEFGVMGHLHHSHTRLSRNGVVPHCKIFSTHIDESDISLGGTERLADAIGNVVQQVQPKVLFILPSTIPEMIGTDLHAVCDELQNQYPETILLPMGAGGFQIDLYRGVQEALLLLAKVLPKDVQRTENITFNIIGSCADAFKFHADSNEIVRIMDHAFSAQPQCILTSNTSVDSIEQLGSAHINIVLRREGIPAAKQLQKRFGTPFIARAPYGFSGTSDWIAEISAILNQTANGSFLAAEREEVQQVIGRTRHLFSHYRDFATFSIGGHADVVEGIRKFACHELGLTQGLCWCDDPAMATDDIPYWSENQWSKEITKDHRGILMASGEVLAWAGHSSVMQIANPGQDWILNPYTPPLMGFRGALNLASLWINAAIPKL